MLAADGARVIYTCTVVSSVSASVSVGMSLQKGSARMRFVAGPGEGLAPLVILNVEDGDTGRTRSSVYLFGAGEGCSRTLLEHKIRPGRSLKAIFSSNITSSSSGGIGGLILRLKQDGHGQVRLLVTNAAAHTAVAAATSTGHYRLPNLMPCLRIYSKNDERHRADALHQLAACPPWLQRPMSPIRQPPVGASSGPAGVAQDSGR